MMQVATNGILSFGEAYNSYEPETFPGVSTGVQNGYLIAPFWDDVDISGGGGSVYYQTFSSEDTDNPLTNTNLNAVNSYINSVHGDNNFAGVWMLVAHWDQVSPYPHGSFQSPIIYPDIYEVVLEYYPLKLRTLQFGYFCCPKCHMHVCILLLCFLFVKCTPQNKDTSFSGHFILKYHIRMLLTNTIFLDNNILLI